MNKNKLIIDTSLFVNPAAARFFGSTPTAAVTKFLKMVEVSQDVEIYMPPSIYSEVMFFAEEKKIPRKLLILINKKPPRKHEIKVPGALLYDLVNSFRDRSDRGLRLAERQVREALQMTPPPPR